MTSPSFNGVKSRKISFTPFRIKPERRELRKTSKIDNMSNDGSGIGNPGFTPEVTISIEPSSIEEARGITVAEDDSPEAKKGKLDNDVASIAKDSFFFGPGRSVVDFPAISKQFPAEKFEEELNGRRCGDFFPRPHLTLDVTQSARRSRRRQHQSRKGKKNSTESYSKISEPDTSYDRADSKRGSLEAAQLSEQLSSNFKSEGAQFDAQESLKTLKKLVALESTPNKDFIAKIDDQDDSSIPKNSGKIDLVLRAQSTEVPAAEPVEIDIKNLQKSTSEPSVAPPPYLNRVLSTKPEFYESEESAGNSENETGVVFSLGDESLHPATVEEEVTQDPKLIDKIEPHRLSKDHHHYRKYHHPEPKNFQVEPVTIEEDSISQHPRQIHHEKNQQHHHHKKHHHHHHHRHKNDDFVLEKVVGSLKTIHQSSQHLRDLESMDQSQDHHENRDTITMKVGRRLLEEWRGKDQWKDAGKETVEGTQYLVGTFLAQNKIDHTPHQLLVQLDELYLPTDHTGEIEWRETARWIRYEEDLESGADRWGKPHVSSLSFHSLLELRHCIEQCSLLLDLWQDDFHQIGRTIVDCLENSDQIQASDVRILQWMIHSRHSHVNETFGDFELSMLAGGRSRLKSINSLQHYFYRQQSRFNTSAEVEEDLEADFTDQHVHIRNPQDRRRTKSAIEIPRSPVWRKAKSVFEMSPSIPRSDSGVSIKEYILQRLTSEENRNAEEVRVDMDKTDDNGSLNFELANGKQANGGPLGNDQDFPIRDPKQALVSIQKAVKTTVKSVRFAAEPDRMSWKKKVPGKKKKKNKSKLLERLSLGSEAAVILVGAVDFLTRPAISFVRLAKAVTMPEVTELSIPVRFVFLLLGPLDAGMDYHEMGRCLGTLFSTKLFRTLAYKAAVKEDLLHGINEFLDNSIVLPPGKWHRKDLMPYERIKLKANWLRQRKRDGSSAKNSMHKTSTSASLFLESFKEHDGHHGVSRRKKLFGGMQDEIVQRFSHFKSDFTDALTMQCLFAVFLLFLSCFFPALTFGAILTKKTYAWLGAKETLLATSLGGIIFSLFSTQPLLLLGVTGPMLIFEESLYKFCKLVHFEFLPSRIWTSLWTLVFCVVTVSLEGSFLIRYLTRFADDIINTLVSVIFIGETVLFLAKIYEIHPIMLLSEYCAPISNETASYDSDAINNFHKNKSVITVSGKSKYDGFQHFSATSQPNTALLSTCLVFGTFVIAYALYRLRSAKILARQIRRILADAGLPIAILFIVFLDRTVLLDDAVTSQLSINVGLIPTRSKRDWLVLPWPVSSLWVPAASMVAGALFFLILFVETEAAELLLTEKKPALKKGTGFHWDLLLSGIIAVFCSFFGLPWICATSVQSLHHFGTLVRYKLRAPGQEPLAVDVLDQRVTGLALSCLIGFSVFAVEIIRKIPVAVLFGVFLYLGVINLHGIQMLKRTLLMFVPIKYHPPVVYCLRVKPAKMHLYTVIQLLCLLLVGVVKKYKSISVLFPFAITVAVLIRHFLLPKIFTKMELLALDGELEQDDEDHEEMYP